METQTRASLSTDAPGSPGLLLAGLAAPAVLSVSIVLAGHFEPGYSHVSQFVSELGAVGASYQKSFNYGGLVLSGLLTILFALGLYPRARPQAALVGSSLIVALAGLGRFVAGVFPCDAGCAMDDMSATATVHAVAGFVALTSGAFAPLLMALGLRGHTENRLFWLSVVLGGSSLILIVILFGLGKQFPYIGVVQRLTLAAFYGWIVAVVFRVEALQSNRRTV